MTRLLTVLPCPKSMFHASGKLFLMIKRFEELLMVDRTIIFSISDLTWHGSVGVEELEDLGLCPGLLDEGLHLLPDLGVVLVDEPEQELALQSWSS